MAIRTVNSIGTQNPIQAVYGGTGVASFTTYMPICGGTTGSGVLQSVSEAGAMAGYVLTYVSNAALPTWQAGSSLPSISTNYQLLSTGTGTAEWYSRYIDTGSNLSVGTGAGNASISGTLNTNLGVNAGTALTTGSNNVAIGYQAMLSETNGARNVIIGSGTSESQNGANDNVIIGYLAGPHITTASGHVCIGSQAMRYNTGTANTVVGYAALGLASGGAASSNCVFGYEAMTTEQGSGSDNCAFGYLALGNQNGVSGNSAFGYQAGLALTSGGSNCAFGYNALSGNNATSSCVFGYQAGKVLDSANNCAFGYEALLTEQTGTGNSAFGYQSLNHQISTSQNSAFGYNSGAALTSGGDNSVFGYEALMTETTGTDNCAFGAGSLATQNGASQNSAFGYASGNALTTGSNNAVFGFNSLNKENTGADNTAIGYSALYQQVGNSGNTGLGAYAGESQTSYTNCTFLGYLADASTGSLTNATAIGYNASVTTSNSLILGNGANVGIGTSSPANILHIVGTYEQHGLTNTTLGSEIFKGQSFVGTNGAVTGVLLSIPVDTGAGNTVVGNVNIAAVQADSSNAAYGTTQAGAWYNLSSVQAVGALPAIVLTTTGGFAVTAAWSISGNDLVLSVTGVALADVKWVASYEYFASLHNLT